jgi:hypothetical protein
MAIAICKDCRKRYREYDGDEGRCLTCAKEQREADREQVAAMAMSARVFGTTDPDELMKR